MDQISNSQIRKLREASVAAGDYYHVDICDVALSGDPRVLHAPVRDANGQSVRVRWTPAEAREECARMIAEARAQGSGRLRPL